MVLTCSICNTASKHIMLYDCQHMICPNCVNNYDKQQCPLCVDTMNHNNLTLNYPTNNNNTIVPARAQIQPQQLLQRFSADQPVISDQRESLFFEWSNKKKQEPRLMSNSSSTYSNAHIVVPQFVTSYVTTGNPTSNHSISQSSKKKQQPLQSSNRQKSITEPAEQSSPQTQSYYTSLFCQKHEEPLSFFNTHSKALLCASCLYLTVNRRSVSSVTHVQSQVLPLKGCYDLIKAELKKFNQELIQFDSKLGESLRICRHSKSVIESNFAAVVAEIGAVAQSMLKQIRNRQKLLTETVTDLLNSKISEYSQAQKQLSKHKNYIKEFRVASSSSSTSAKKSANDKVQDVAFLFQTGKQLKQMLTGVKTQYKQFGLAQLNLFRFNKREFQSGLQSFFRLNIPSTMAKGQSASKSPNKKGNINLSMRQSNPKNSVSILQNPHHLRKSSAVQKTRSNSYFSVMKRGNSKVNLTSLN